MSIPYCQAKESDVTAAPKLVNSLAKIVVRCEFDVHSRQLPRVSNYGPNRLICGPESSILSYVLLSTEEWYAVQSRISDSSPKHFTLMLLSYEMGIEMLTAALSLVRRCVYILDVEVLRTDILGGPLK